MKDIKILGTGCSKCKTVMQLVEKIAKQHNYEGKIEKVEDIAEIISYGVMSTPAVSDVYKRQVHAGSSD